MKYLVSKALLDLYDRYGGDLGLLDERWVPEADRRAFAGDQIRTLAEYVDKIRLLEVGCLAPSLRAETEGRIMELAQSIEPGVIEILEKRAEQDRRR